MRPLPVTLPVSSVKGSPRPEPLRFVVFKGFEGFGDRLQCLLQALRYARGTGRLLVVDWRDDLWSHGAGLDFEDFMEIRGVKTFRVPEFLRVWSALRPQLRVHPASWATRLDEPTNADIYKVSLAFNSSWMWPIATHRKPDFEEEIVVYPGVRTRRSNYKDIRYLRLRRWLALEVRKRMRNEGLEAGKYGVVHLRGADKPWRCENLQRRRGERHQDRRASAVHLDHIAKRWPSEESYLVDLRRQLDRLATNFTADAHSTGPAGGFRMVVISDLPCLREAYPVLDANRNGPGREHGAGDGEDSYVVHPQVAEVDLPRHSCADDGHARACRASRLRRLWDESKPCASFE